MPSTRGTNPMNTEPAESNASAATPSEPLQGRMRGGHDPVAMAKRSAEVRRERSQDRQERLAQGLLPDDLGSVEGLRGLATGELRKLLRSKTTADAVKVQAARAIQDMSRGQQVAQDVDLLAWRDVLAQLPTEQRLAYLREVSGVVGASPPLAQ